MFVTEFNWLAILVSAVAFMAVGAFWYGPLFQKPWMRMTGITEESAKAGAGKAYASMFVVAVISVIVLAVFINTLEADSFVEGMLVGLLIWVGFVATVMLNPVIFEKRPFALFLLNSGYNLVVLLVAGGILAVWQ